MTQEQKDSIDAVHGSSTISIPMRQDDETYMLEINKDQAYEILKANGEWLTVMIYPSKNVEIWGREDCGYGDSVVTVS